jgi:hypothetical protein
MFFQIHKDGSAVDGKCYGSLGQASAVLVRTARGGEVTEDACDRIVRRYTIEECRQAVLALRHLKPV